MKLPRLAIVLLAGASAVVLSSCSSTEDVVQRTHFHARPALYAKLLKSKRIDRATYDRWNTEWKKEEAQRLAAAAQQRRQQEEARRAHQRFLASMTPGERAAYELRQRELQMQQEQFNAMMAQQQQAMQAAAIQNQFAQIQAQNARQAAASQAAIQNAAAGFNNVYQNSVPRRYDVNIRHSGLPTYRPPTIYAPRY